MRTIPVCATRLCARRWATARAAAQVLLPRFIVETPLKPLWEEHPMDSLRVCGGRGREIYAGGGFWEPPFPSVKHWWHEAGGGGGEVGDQRHMVWLQHGWLQGWC
jgi:hypothetical protein